jgi:enoyl-CoA hydratase/carnithine racemase
MSFVNFTVDTDANGIGLITWDAPGRSMNVIDLKTIEELNAIVEQVATDPAIKGAVVTSGKETFCAGADLTMLDMLSRTFTDMVKARGDLRQAVGGCDQRHGTRRRIRAVPSLPLSRRFRKRQDPRRPT